MKKLKKITLSEKAAKELFYLTAVESFNLGVNEGPFPETSLFELFNSNIEKAFEKYNSNPNFWGSV